MERIEAAAELRSLARLIEAFNGSPAVDRKAAELQKNLIPLYRAAKEAGRAEADFLKQIIGLTLPGLTIDGRAKLIEYAIEAAAGLDGVSWRDLAPIPTAEAAIRQLFALANELDPIAEIEFNATQTAILQVATIKPQSAVDLASLANINDGNCRRELGQLVRMGILENLDDGYALKRAHARADGK